MDDAARIVVETVRGATTSVGEVMFVLFDEGSWRDRKARRSPEPSQHVQGGDGSVIQAVNAGGDVRNVSQKVSQVGSSPATHDVRKALQQFRDAVKDAASQEDRDAGESAAATIERGLGDPEEQRDGIRGAAYTISLLGRTVASLAGSATAVHDAVKALLPS